MPDKDIVDVSLRAFKEIVNGSGLPVISVLGSLAERALQKRTNAALEILAAEIEAGRHDGVTFDESDADDAAQMFMRFIRASSFGAANRNLRLLARVIIGLKRNRTLEFDRFQTWANILETLTRDEIIFLGHAYRVLEAQGEVDFWKNLQDRLTGTFDNNQKWQISSSLIRTGLLIPSSAFSSLTFTPSPGLKELGELAKLQDTDVPD